MDYVSEEAAQVARDWEKRFAELPAKAGLVFVSVKPTPASNGTSGQYTITLGFDKNMPVDESTGHGVILKVLKDEVASGMYLILANVFRGIPCGAHVSA